MVASVSLPLNFPAGLRVLLLTSRSGASNGNGDTATLRLLSQCQYQVTGVKSVTEALAALTPVKHDVILAEHSAVPRILNNNEFREIVKQVPTLVMLDPNTDPDEVLRIIKFGVVEVLEKPLCPLKVKNIWQHAVRRMMKPSQRKACKTASGTRRTSCSSDDQNDLHSDDSDLLIDVSNPPLAAVACTEIRTRSCKRKSKELHRSVTANSLEPIKIGIKPVDCFQKPPAMGAPADFPKDAACGTTAFGTPSSVQVPGCAGGSNLPAGMVWGAPIIHQAPGITPPIFPQPTTTPTALNPPFFSSPFFSAPTAANPFPMSIPGMGMNMGMAMNHQLSATPQLPALPMPMLMSACSSQLPGSSSPGLAGCAAAFDPLAAPCSPSCATDPSMTTMSDKSAQDLLLGLDDLDLLAAPESKMQRVESNGMLPSLEDLMNDSDSMDVHELDALSLAFKRPDSFDNLLGPAVMAF